MGHLIANFNRPPVVIFAGNTNLIERALSAVMGIQQHPLKRPLTPRANRPPITLNRGCGAQPPTVIGHSYRRAVVVPPIAELQRSVWVTKPKISIENHLTTLPDECLETVQVDTRMLHLVKDISDLVHRLAGRKICLM